MTSFSKGSQRITALALALAMTTSAAAAFAQTQPAPQPYPPPAQPYPPPPGQPYPPQPYPPQPYPPQPYPPPPQYVYPPQPYPQPVYQYPATLPYEEGRPIPQGYHTRTTVRRGLIIGGSVTFGVLYVLSLIAADAGRQDSNTGGGENKLSGLYVPVIGPFITMSKTESGSSSILLLDGLGQTAGVLMFISGFAFPKTELVRNDLGSVRVMPLMGRGQSGLSLVGTF